MCTARIEKLIKIVIKGFIISFILAVISYPVIKIFHLEEFNCIRYYAVIGFYAMWLITNIAADIIIIKNVKKMRGE